ncbi:hypothetical protein [Duganella hordei]|uniref:hypothetical protein n=1 Tax=Duganella hordei TaxID=2865934 RepID=UPI0033428D18
MPRPTKRTTTITQADIVRLQDVVRLAREELKIATPLAKNSQSEYARRAALLSRGWDMAKATKNERYAMRAAGVWEYRRQIKAALREADKATRSQVFLAPVRQLMWAEEVEKAEKLIAALDAFRALPWTDFTHARKQEADHKKQAATDAQLEVFFDAVGASEFRQAFLVTEFSGCRGQELGNGVRIETKKINGAAALCFFVESVKADGKKKGLDLREVVSRFPRDAAPAVQRRWLELANQVADNRRPLVVKVDATEGLSAGQRFTKIFCYFAKKSKIPISAYSMRHRVSAQSKAAGDSESTAAVLGHQTTETQRHYGRAKRGGGAVSPVEIRGVNHSGAPIRGTKQRTGPPSSCKESVALKVCTPHAAHTASASRRGPSL